MHTVTKDSTSTDIKNMLIIEMIHMHVIVKFINKDDQLEAIIRHSEVMP